MKRRLVILDLKKYLELLRRFVQIVMENEKFVSKCRQLLELCRLLVLVMYVNEFEKFIRKDERPCLTPPADNRERSARSYTSECMPQGPASSPERDGQHCG